MAQLIMVEGLPGAGKSTTAHLVTEWLVEQGLCVGSFPEGRTDHPVDFEQVAVLADGELDRVIRDFPGVADTMRRAAERSGDGWLIRYGDRPEWSGDLRARLAAFDAYDGEITADRHCAVLRASWEAFGAWASHDVDVYVFECVLIQNPMCALMARFDQPVERISAHVRALVRSVSSLEPVVLYLDPGEPTGALERAAAERPPEWLDAVVQYHCAQGYGLARGLSGFSGYVEFMRERRERELALLPELGIPVIRVDVAAQDWNVVRVSVTGALTTHLSQVSTG
ncbi:hypothetical protein N864_08125 [Intrasporangium chromatireducens Q5-1]|uniref:Thymidylate kinase n=1 Tax=Intrasporangium chromatireducens Q5-1 TaxID=584657 RepID=W9GG35_9MICO|nr:hypothetical protein [Intrasporangium chromatireducens]EWT04995.1 hypothetical protein N864_08125 [Intrasporangium chromatireducens Q5-1]